MKTAIPEHYGGKTAVTHYAPSCYSSLTPTIRGSEQEYKKVEDLELSSDQTVGADNRVYVERNGLIKCLAPAVPEGDPLVYVESVQWEDFPPMGELAALFDDFFSKYDREVLMLMGRKRDGSGWLFHVPEQEGSGAFVEWKAEDDEMATFQDEAKWVGTIHVHPGNGCTPSQTDIDDWAEPEKSGLHLIFGRDGSYTINGAIAGKTFELLSGSLDGVEREMTEYTISQNRSLEEVLKEKTYKNCIFSSGTSQHYKSWKGDRWFPSNEIQDEVENTENHFRRNTQNQSYVLNSLDLVGAIRMEETEPNTLYYLQVDKERYILTRSQVREFQQWCFGFCSIPKVRRINLREEGEVEDG